LTRSLAPDLCPGNTPVRAQWLGPPSRRSAACVSTGCILAGCIVTAGIIAFGERTARAEDQPRSHDGFYVRAAAGFAVYDERLSTSGAGADIKGRTRGISSLSELAFGGTIARGWVVGGGIYTADLATASYHTVTEPPPAELDPELRTLALMGPFFDRYFDPDGGTHFQVAIGLAWLSPRAFGDEATEQSEYLALGGGVMLGIGQEFWISDTLSLGVLARATVSYLEGEDTTNQNWQHLVLTSPGLMVTLTYQ